MTVAITVLGAGSWGTALALVLAENGHAVTLWSHNKSVANAIQQQHCNTSYLPTINLPPNIQATIDLAVALQNASVIFCVVPSHALRAVMTQAAIHIPNEAIVVSCSKGIEIKTGQLMSQVLASILPVDLAARCCYLSGPSFAQEVAQHLPTALVIAGRADISPIVQALLRSSTLLPYTHNDIAGVEVGGAVKNVLAIAAGISDGLNFGSNTRAALLTRGLYEMIKIGQVYGAKPLTFSGLAGIGDLILTCTGGLSRNRQVGVDLAQGRSLAEITAGMHMVAEGIKTAEALHQVIEKNKITAPICQEVYQILYHQKPPAQAVRDILRLQIGAEQGGLV